MPPCLTSTVRRHTRALSDTASFLISPRQIVPYFCRKFQVHRCRPCFQGRKCGYFGLGTCEWPRPEDKPLVEYTAPQGSLWCHVILGSSRRDIGLWEKRTFITKVTRYCVFSRYSAYDALKLLGHRNYRIRTIDRTVRSSYSNGLQNSS